MGICRRRSGRDRSCIIYLRLIKKSTSLGDRVIKVDLTDATALYCLGSVIWLHQLVVSDGFRETLKSSRMAPRLRLNLSIDGLGKARRPL